MTMEEVINICSKLGDYAEIKMTERGIAISLFCYEIDFGYGDIECNSDEIYEVVNNLESRFNIKLGDINQEVDEFVRRELEVPEDDFSIGDERSYTTMLVEI